MAGGDEAGGRRLSRPALRLLDERGRADRGARRGRDRDLLLREVSAAERELHRERRAPAFLARGADGAAVELHQLLHEREPDAGAFLRPAARPFDAVEALEDPADFRGGHAGARVADPQLRAVAVLPERDLDAPGKGELVRVGEEVEDDLLPHVAIDVDGLAQGRAVHVQLEARALDGGAEHARDVGRERPEVEGNVGGLHPARLDTREVEQRVDELEEPHGIAPQDGELVALGGLERGAEQLVHGAEDERERRAELVAHVAEEHRLRRVEPRQRLGALAFGLVGAGVGDGGGDLARDQLEEARVLVVERQHRAHTDHEDAGPSRIARGPDRKHESRRPARNAPDLDRGPALHRFVDGPGRGADRGDRQRRVDTLAGRRRERQPARFVGEIEERETDVAAIFAHHPRRHRAHRRNVVDGRGGAAELTQGPQAARRDHLRGRFRHGGEGADHRPLLVVDRAVREREVRLFAEALAVEEQERVLRPGGLAALEHALEHRPDDRPDLRPHLAARGAERGRVLGTEHLGVAVVVDERELRAPPEEEREARVDDYPDAGP